MGFSHNDRRILRDEKENKRMINMFSVLLSQTWLLKIQIFRVMLTKILISYQRKGWQPASIFLRELRRQSYTNNHLSRKRRFSERDSDGEYSPDLIDFDEGGYYRFEV